MILTIVILTVIVIGCVAWYMHDEWAGAPIIIGLVAGCLLLVALLMSFKWQIGSATLTGYVYQRSETMGYVWYDLRFSLNAGQDKQPSFCTKADSPTDKSLRELVGSDEKVELYIPSKAPFLANNAFECPAEASIKGGR